MGDRKETIPWQAVFFDFDGVILDSVHVKTKAFASMFSNYGPEIEKQVVDYHLAHGGISRFDKFRYYYKELLHSPVTDKQIAELGEEFSKLALQGVLKAPFIKGSLESLKALHRQKIPAFVVSGTPQEELEYIIKNRDINLWFKEIHGSPRLKHEIVMDILPRYNLEPFSCLFIGDAMTDYNAATAAGTGFLGIVSQDISSPFPPGTSVSPDISLF